VQRRLRECKLKVDLIEEEDMSFVRRNVRSERWYAMRSSKLELEADLIVGGIVEEGIVLFSNRQFWDVVCNEELKT
jgi:hypothetical protein